MVGRAYVPETFKAAAFGVVVGGVPGTAFRGTVGIGWLLRVVVDVLDVGFLRMAVGLGVIGIRPG